MTKRIPERGTPRYQRYWAERRLLDELRALEASIAVMSTHPDVYGNAKQYESARALLMGAVEMLETGWRLGIA